MTHTYRDDRFLASRVADLGGYVLVLALIASLIPWAIIDGLDHGFTWGDALIAACWTGVALAVAVAMYRHYYRRCGEIRLSDDGTCELETKRGLVRLHTNDIRSVKYRRDSESDRESYTIRYRGGTLKVSDRMTGFADFLARLRALNPAVDLSSFPAETWPGLRTTTVEADATLRRLAGMLFPMGVVALLVFVAINTLQGN